VEHFRCVRAAKIQFGPGLNVLHGPNDLGKSSLAEAIRAALLLQATSRDHEEYLDWAGTGDPHVELVFESEPQRIWRVKKTFGSVPQAFLEESRNAVDFHVEARGRDVDGRLSKILRWGVAPPGGKGRPKGMPITFLSTALLAEQDRVAAILDHALSEDSDESGKKRLIEALQAVAENPLFKAVLSSVQAKVDEAFSTTGRKKTGKNSPWMQVRELIRRAEDYERQCNEQSQKTIAIETELRDLYTQQLEHRAAVEHANGILEQIEHNHHTGELRQGILKRLQVSNTQLSDITTTLQELATADTAHRALTQHVNDLREQEQSAHVTLADATKNAQAAKEAVARLQSKDHARERLLKRTALEKRRADLLTETVQTEVLLTRIRSVEAATTRATTEESQHCVLTATITTLKQRHEEAMNAVRAADEQEQALRSITQLLRSNAARRGIEEAENGLAQVTAWREEIAQQRAAATALEESLARVSLPSATQLEDIKHLDHQRQLALARLSVGLQLQLRPKRQLTVGVRRDDEAPSQHELSDTSFETSATRQIQLDLEGLAEITLSGGQIDARDQVNALQQRWLTEATPVLQQAGVATLEELASLASDVAKRSQDLQAAHRVADQLDQRVADQRDWAALRADHQRELAAAEDSLGPADRETLDATARRLGIADAAGCGAQLELIRTERTKLVETETNLVAQLTTANATNIEKQNTLATVRKELLDTQSSIDGEWQDLLPPVLDKQSTLDNELTAINTELETLTAEIDKTLTEAQNAQGIAESARLAADAKHRKVTEELRAEETRQATNDGALKVRRETAAKLDESAARHAVEQLHAELNLVPAPAYGITDDMLTEARATVEAARNQLRDIENDIQGKRGALEHVGGEVAKQRAEAAQEALKYAREREQVLEHDYAAWELLRVTLREAEREEGVHLGIALGDPIAERFSALTDRRYGPVALGPNLETHTISAAGDARSVSALSVGTRDQLSTIFRLSLAEQLQSAVLLDDQLTQSDTQRMDWLRDLIRKLAANIQILVFTCRPDDYLLPAELKLSKKAEPAKSFVRSINLAEVIERSGTASPNAEDASEQKTISE
jgi:hypothetical protein